MRNKTLFLVAGAVLVFAGAAAAAAVSDAGLPDWSGDWVATPSKDPAPAYRPDWVSKRRATRVGKPVSDPLKTCGIPAGLPRDLAISGTHEWIIRPEAVRHAVENGNSVERIYTDGRSHPEPDDQNPTYTGDNIGHWDGDTLVIDTVALRDDTWLDDLGHDHSDQIHIVTRVRKLADGRLEARAEIEDPLALAKPWTIVRYYKRLPAGSFVRDYACTIVKTAKQAASLY